MARRLHKEKSLKPRGPKDKSHLAKYSWKKGQSGNPKGRSQKVRVSDAIVEELAQVDENGTTRAEVLASKLVTRAENDSSELGRVLHLTEPELMQKQNSSFGLAVQTEDFSVVFSKLIKD